MPAMLPALSPLIAQTMYSKLSPACARSTRQRRLSHRQMRLARSRGLRLLLLGELRKVGHDDEVVVVLTGSH
eukprot:6198673-Amphidinium_carterae.2